MGEQFTQILGNYLARKHIVSKYRSLTYREQLKLMNITKN